MTATQFSGEIAKFDHLFLFTLLRFHRRRFQLVKMFGVFYYLLYFRPFSVRNLRFSQRSLLRISLLFETYFSKNEKTVFFSKMWAEIWCLCELLFV